MKNNLVTLKGESHTHENGVKKVYLILDGDIRDVGMSTVFIYRAVCVETHEFIGFVDYDIESVLYINVIYPNQLLQYAKKIFDGKDNWKRVFDKDKRLIEDNNLNL